MKQMRSAARVFGAFVLSDKSTEEVVELACVF
jgi:hypothetical protein